MPLSAQIVLFDGFDPLDVIAPFEVLSAGSDAMDGGLDVELVSAEGPRPVVSGTRGLTLTATAALDPGRPGYVIVPGAAGPVGADPDGEDTIDGDAETIPARLARFAGGDAAPLLSRALENPAVTVVTVCGGSLALAMAGLIAGRHAVTHHLGQEILGATGAIATKARVVDDGDLITGGGVTSGLDVALYLLDREFGSATARAVEDLIEYERRGTAWRAARTADAPVPA